MQEDIKDENLKEAIKITHEHERFFNKMQKMEEAFTEAVEQNEKEHEEIYKRLAEKDVQDAVMRAQLDTIVKNTARIEEKIDKQEEIPKLRWEKVINTTITVIVTAMATAFVTQIIK